MSNEDGEIQPVIEPGESKPPMSKADAKTEKEAKVKIEKKSKSDAKAAIGNPWNTGVFSCHEDRTNAVVTAFLPCITFGQIAEVLDEGRLASPWGSFFYLLMMPAVCSQWIMGSKYRKNLRKKYDLVEAPYTDKVSHIFCTCCSLCQEYRELKVRGLDPSLEAIDSIKSTLCICAYRLERNPGSKKWKTDSREAARHSSRESGDGEVKYACQ